MTVRIMVFGILREHAGASELELELGERATVADALASLRSRGPLSDLLGRVHVCMAVNRSYAAPETVLAPGDELALIPPLSGGAGPGEPAAHDPGRGPYVRITAQALSLEELSAAVGRPGAGAIVVFQGVTREVSCLDYEAYTAMAEESIGAILTDCIARHDLEAAAAAHRVGAVALGEPSVIVAVSAAHRAAAFAGARDAIDRIKAEAPIWKREALAGGATRWADGALPSGARTTGAQPLQDPPGGPRS